MKIRTQIQHSAARDEVLKHQLQVVTQLILTSVMVAEEIYDSDSSFEGEGSKSRKLDHRSFPRRERKVYDHTLCWKFLMKNYLGPRPLFDGREFDTMFRISRARFERLRQDIGNHDIKSSTPISRTCGVRREPQ